jgi:hypothetical protein
MKFLLSSRRSSRLLLRSRHRLRRLSQSLFLRHRHRRHRLHPRRRQ